MLPTMAMKITTKNYPIVAACFNSWFVHTTEDGNALGSYVVINKLTKEPFFKKEIYPEYNNSWMDEELFRKEYTFMDKELEDQFAEVQAI